MNRQCRTWRLVEGLGGIFFEMEDYVERDVRRVGGEGDWRVRATDIGRWGALTNELVLFVFFISFLGRKKIFFC